MHLGAAIHDPFHRKAPAGGRLRRVPPDTHLRVPPIRAGDLPGLFQCLPWPVIRDEGPAKPRLIASFTSRRSPLFHNWVPARPSQWELVLANGFGLLSKDTAVVADPAMLAGASGCLEGGR